MITYIILTIVLIGILDTMFGNYYFPSKEEIVFTKKGTKWSKPNVYLIRKKTRIFFIPIWFWGRRLRNHMLAIFDIEDFGSFYWTFDRMEAEAFLSTEDAKQYLTKNRRLAERVETGIGDGEVVYSTRGTTPKSWSDEAIIEAFNLKSSEDFETTIMRIKELQKQTA